MRSQGTHTSLSRENHPTELREGWGGGTLLAGVLPGPRIKGREDLGLGWEGEKEEHSVE